MLVSCWAQTLGAYGGLFNLSCIRWERPQRTGPIGASTSLTELVLQNKRTEGLKLTVVVHVCRNNGSLSSLEYLFTT
jgi:hypothetical protein